MAMGAAALCGRYGHGIGVELLVKEFQGGMVGFVFLMVKCGEFQMGKTVMDGFGHWRCECGRPSVLGVRAVAVDTQYDVLYWYCGASGTGMKINQFY